MLPQALALPHPPQPGLPSRRLALPNAPRNQFYTMTGPAPSLCALALLLLALCTPRATGAMPATCVQNINHAEWPSKCKK